MAVPARSRALETMASHDPPKNGPPPTNALQRPTKTPRPADVEGLHLLGRGTLIGGAAAKPWHRDDDQHHSNGPLNVSHRVNISSRTSSMKGVRRNEFAASTAPR